MNVRIKLNLDVLVNTSFIDTFYLEFDNITNLQHWYDEENVTKLEFEQSSTEKRMHVFDDGATTPSYSEVNRDIVTLSADSNYIIFTCEISNSSYNKVNEFIQKGIIELDFDGYTGLIAYTQYDANHNLLKTLTFVDIIQGKFNNSIGLKNIDVDIINYSFNYNYIYIPKLKRYYYVDSVELISSDFTRLHLKEDVLMTWKDLIRMQQMYITRYQYSDESYIIDDRLPLESKYSIDYEELDETDAQNSLVNCTFDFSYNSADLVYFVTTIATLETSNNYGVLAPAGSELPNIYPRKNKNKHYYLLNYEEYGYFNVACIKKSSTASFVESALWLPFKPVNTNGFIITDNKRMFASTEALTMNKTWEDAGSSGYTFVSVHEVENGAIPYLVTHDFTFPDATSFEDYKPYKSIELFIAFVGYISVSVTELAGKRCLIYYALNVDNGSATCFLYNYTDKKVVWSSACQLGIKMEFNTTNFYQNGIQKELLAINTTFSSLQNAVSGSTAYASGNYGKMITSFLGAVGDIVKLPLQDALIQDSMSTSFGSSENALYTRYDSILKITYRKEIEQEDFSDYTQMQGLPYNKYVDGVPNSFTGYAEIGEIRFKPLYNNIYQDEIDEIVQLLKNGVIF